ncbi:GNAT family N-acetyltransferase [Mycoplasmatota bacterium WC30]
MEKSVYIRKLTINDVVEYKRIRLELLKNEPNSFGSSYEEESKFEDAMWNNRLTKSHVVTFGCFDKNNLIGIIVVVMNPRRKLKHVATLNSMYVKEAYRHNGYAKALIKTATEYLYKAGIEIIKLSVVTENLKAFDLYKNLGFEIYGEEKNSIKVGKKYIDQYLMAKNIVI